MTLLFESLFMIAIVCFGFFSVGFIIPIGCTLGNFVSDKIESFLHSL